MISLKTHTDYTDTEEMLQNITVTVNNKSYVGQKFHGLLGLS